MIDAQISTVTNMMLARGVPSADQVTTHYDLGGGGGVHFLHLEATVESGHKVHAMWFREAKIGVREMRAVLDAHGENDEFIFIARQGATAYTARTIAQGVAQRVVVFCEAQVQHDITQHVLVPRHTQCTAEEHAEVLRTLNCKDSQLATLEYDDPIRRYHNYSPGALIRIDRFWCNMTFYRIVGDEPSASLPSSSSTAEAAAA